MRVKIEEIVVPWYAPREEIDKEFVKELAESLKRSGQWDPVLLRRSGEGKYELIAGLQRLEAAKLLGWKEVEASVIDVSEEEAALMAIETNIMRRGLKEIEEGKAIKKIMEKFGLTQKEIARRLGKSETWVSSRLTLALDVSKAVQDAIFRNEISMSQAVVIGQLPKNKQHEFLKFLVQKQKKLGRKFSDKETRLEIKKFQNDTIYTIGYEGRTLDEFVSILQKHKIELLLDVRESGKSVHNPEFNEDVLARYFREHPNLKIRYERRPELGVPFEVRQPYIEGFLPKECFERWYEWHVRYRKQDFIPELVKIAKESGRTCLMCAERYAVPKDSQKHYCHRYFLAEMMIKYRDEDPLLRFSRRVDL